MTDREPHAPTANPSPARALAPVPAPVHPDPHHEGNGSLMSALLEAPPHPPTLGPAPREEHRVDPNDRGRALLTVIFQGEFSFTAVTPTALPPGPRSAAEHDAASRAAGCRDLFIVHADPFAGEKLIADVARATSDRILILSPNPVSADRIAERLLKCGVTVLRALADDDNPVRPSPLVSKVTALALGVGRIEQAQREAAAALAAAEKRMCAFAPVAKVIARLIEVNDALMKLDAVVAEHTARRDRVEADTRVETNTPLSAALAKLQSDHTATTTRLAAELQTATASHAERSTALGKAKEHLAAAARKPGFFGRLFGKPKPGASEAADAEKQVHALEAEVAALTSRVADLQKKIDNATTALGTEREKMIAAEIAARRAACEEALTASESDRARARAEVTALNKAISDKVPNDNHADAERALTAARERADEVNRTAAEDIRRAVTEPRVVVGTPSSLGSDPVFAALKELKEPTDPPFGLLVLDRAEELPESAFPQLARFAERWVLVGDVLPPDPRAFIGPARAPRGRAPEPSFVARVAKLLDRETWTIEGDRLVCRLAHLTTDQRRDLTREPLADRPEIELRFTPAADDPLPAEIAFPASTPIPDAKRFLFHTLNEVLLRPCGDLAWKHEPDAIFATWPAADADRDSMWIDLEPGVREKVVGTGLFAYTAAVRFDPAEGWDAEKAAAWLAKYLPPPASGRFLALPRSR